MENKVLLKLMLSALYLLGVICVITFSVNYISHSTTVLNPDAMLPMMAYEAAIWHLIIVLPFMAFLGISIVLTYKIRKVFNVVLVLMPSFICFVMGVSYIAIN